MPANGGDKHARSSLAALAAAAYTHPFPVLLVWALVTIAALAAAGHLRLDTDLVGLLPRDAPSVQALDRLHKRTGGEGALVVVGEGGTAATLKRFAHDVAARLRTVPYLGTVATASPVTWFADRAGYFLTLTELTTIRDRIAARVVWERALAGEPVGSAHLSGPPLDFGDLVGSITAARGWLHAQLVGDGRYLDSTARQVAVVAYPRGRASDIAFARRVVAAATQALAEIDPTTYGDDFRFALTERYVNRVRLADRVERDIRQATLVAAAAMALFLAMVFGPRSVLLIGVPLTLALVATYGGAALLFGRVNILTALLGTILGGLGLDHGIHLAGRAALARRDGGEVRQALIAAYRHGGGAVLTAALTTGIAFAAVATSEFRAFREFGILAGLGMALLLAAYATALPALVRVLGLGLGHTERVSAWGTRAAKSLTHHRRWWLAAAVPLALATVWGAIRVDFAVDFAALERFDPELQRLNEVADKLVGATLSPLAVLADSQQAQLHAAAELRAAAATHGAETTIDFVFATSDLVPAGQAAKAVLLRDIHDWLVQLRLRSVPREQAHAWERLLRMTQAAPFTAADVPDAVWQQFGGRDPGDVVLVFPRIDPGNGRDVLRLARQVRAVPTVAGGAAVAAGEHVILADVLAMLLAEGPAIAAETLLAIALALAVFLRRLWPVLLVLLGAAGTVTGMLALMTWTGQTLDYLNVVLLPVVFGLAVDAGIHAVVPAVRRHPHTRGSVIAAVAASLVTTSIGFAALLVAAHPGVRHLGAAALLGMAANAAVVVFWIAPVAWRSHPVPAAPDPVQ